MAVDAVRRRQEAQARPGAFARLRSSPRTGAIGLPLLVLVVLIGGWEILARSGAVNEIIVPPASEVGASVVELVQQGFFWENAKVTLIETFAGFAIGVSIAWVVGTAIGLSVAARRAFYPPAVALEITPRVALAPLFLTWFGFGVTSKIVMAATICFFPVLLAAIVGLQTVDHEAKTLMRSLGASRWEEYRKLGFPSSLPFLFNGLKHAMTLALVGAIVAEFVGASEGLGVLIKSFNFQLNVADGFAVIIILMIIGLVLYGIVEWLDKKIVFWKSRS
jgi:NitT/TauT family transport system permease protein